MTTNADLLQTIAGHIRAHSDRAQANFGKLSEVQLNWQPHPDTWSVGVILDHLIVTHQSYFPVLDSIVEGTYKMNFWSRISPFSGLLGRSLIKQLGPDYAKKFKSPPAFRPTHSKVDPGILDEFIACQDRILSILDGLQGRPISKLRMPSPASGFITYPVRDALQVIDVHTARHFQQADRLMAHDEFPA
jgi:hypothetical protein